MEEETTTPVCTSEVQLKHVENLENVFFSEYEQGPTHSWFVVGDRDPISRSVHSFLFLKKHSSRDPKVHRATNMDANAPVFKILLTKMMGKTRREQGGSSLRQSELSHQFVAPS